MRLKQIALIAFAACIPAIAVSATDHYNKLINILHSPDDRECLFFQLTGISEADPVSPGNPWFAVPKTHTGFKEITAMLLSARISGASISTVGTTGTLACGHAAVRVVVL